MAAQLPTNQQSVPRSLCPAGATVFNAGEVCGADPSIGYFYIHNSCNLALDFTLKVRAQQAQAGHGV